MGKRTGQKHGEGVTKDGHKGGKGKKKRLHREGWRTASFLQRKNAESKKEALKKKDKRSKTTRKRGRWGERKRKVAEGKFVKADPCSCQM